MSWNVIYTKSRFEKKVEERLKNIGIEAYCPVRTEVKSWSDRKKTVLVPVLPSMVLVKIDDNKRNEVFDIPGEYRVISTLITGGRCTLSPQDLTTTFNVEFGDDIYNTCTSAPE